MRKGLSLHVGVDYYNPRWYREQGYKLARLPSSERDAKAMERIARRSKFRTALLANEKATKANMLKGIEFAAWYLKHGDIFLLTFSGHGSEVLDRNGDEEGKFDQTWCLYDRMVIDDELFEHWKMFRPGVRIVVISDSCHSGTSIKDCRRSLWDMHTGFTARKGSELNASCLLLAACQDTQYASARSDVQHSIYTHWMLRVLNRPEHCSSYLDLHRKISAHMPSTSKPNLFKLGRDADLLARTKPFKI